MECTRDHREECREIMRALKITPKGSEIINIKPELESYQRLVGGNIDSVTIVPGKLAMIVNDEGLLLELPLNPGASAIAERCIIGDVCIVGVDEDDFTDIPSAVLPALMSVANLALAAYQIFEGSVD